MEKLFLSVLNMSLTAAYVIVFIMLIRLPLKKVPKVISYALWGVAAFRLLCPFSFKSVFSLLPTSITPIPYDIAYQQNPQINSGIIAVDTYVNRVLPSPSVFASANPLQIYIQIGLYIWILGIAAMFLYSVVSILILKRRLKSAQHMGKNIYEADNLKTPFVLGIFRPRIYIPAGLTAEEKSHIIRHEQTHICRFDHIVKPFAFFVLSIHWFNPLVWIAFLLMSTDMELSCDEKVIKEMGSEIKKVYSASLLSLAMGKRILNGSPLAFGEGSVKGRIRNVLHYKKPVFWIVVMAVIVVIAMGIGLVSNPRQEVALMHSSIFDGNLQNDKIVSVILKGPQDNQTASAIITTKGGNFGWEQLTSFLESVMVNKKEVSQSRAGSRDKTHQIILNRQIGENLIPIEINFSSDFVEVWINDALIKPGYSYRVINPAAVSEYYNAFFASLAPKSQLTLHSHIISFTTVETDLIQIGRIAFDEYMSSVTGGQTPVKNRIASYKLNDISILAGDINEFCISVNYDYTTDNDEFINPGDGANGKGTWSDIYREIRVKNIGKYLYEIVSTGTGGGGQGLSPVEGSVSYGLIRLGNGEVLRAISPLSGDSAQLAEDVIMNYMIKSAAWPGVDINTLEECYLLRSTYSDGTIANYYAYLLDGKAVMQNGADGYYSRIDDGLYQRLVKLVQSSTAIVGGVGGPINITVNNDRTDLGACVADAILAANMNQYHNGDFAAEAHTILKTVESASTTTVYAMALYMEFGYSGGGFSETGGNHMPVAITFQKNADREYKITEYWVPQDGSYYAPSIKRKFPSDIYEDALDTQKHVVAHIQSCYEQAMKYGKVDVDEQISKLIETITSSPAQMSNLQAYIQEHITEYRKLIYFGKHTLRYCFTLFESGGQTGLDGHIMASACRDILGEAEDIHLLANTGQDWYEAFKRSAENLRRQNGDDYMEKNMPGSWLLLKIFGVKRESGLTNLE